MVRSNYSKAAEQNLSSKSKWLYITITKSVTRLVWWLYWVESAASGENWLDIKWLINTKPNKKLTTIISRNKEINQCCTKQRVKKCSVYKKCKSAAARYGKAEIKTGSINLSVPRPFQHGFSRWQTPRLAEQARKQSIINRGYFYSQLDLCCRLCGHFI